MVTTVYRAAYGDRVRHRRRIIQRGDGNFTFDEEVWLPEEYVDAPRAGMEFELAEGFDTASWIGLGPWENCPDRSSAALRGRWSSPIDELTVPYILPQENSTRLENTSHWWKLPDSAATVVHVDIAHRRVGTGRLGPDTRSRHRLHAGHYAWRRHLLLEK